MKLALITDQADKLNDQPEDAIASESQVALNDSDSGE
jgi:hypothetical protein